MVVSSADHDGKRAGPMSVLDRVGGGLMVFLDVGNERSDVPAVMHQRADWVAAFEAGELPSKSGRRVGGADSATYVFDTLVIGNADQAPFASLRHFHYT